MLRGISLVRKKWVWNPYDCDVGYVGNLKVSKIVIFVCINKMLCVF